jgi:hypothetical protein
MGTGKKERKKERKKQNVYFLNDRIANVSQGMLDLRVWPGQEADGNFPSTTPGKARDHGKEQMQRLAKVYFLSFVRIVLTFLFFW